VLITHASGGMDSGFAILLMVTVAAAAIFVSRQIATLVAAVASLAVLADTRWH
jgi:two-component system sensor histidine kinase PilS (NtrC family)